MTGQRRVYLLACSDSPAGGQAPRLPAVDDGAAAPRVARRRRPLDDERRRERARFRDARVSKSRPLSPRIYSEPLHNARTRLTDKR